MLAAWNAIERGLAGLLAGAALVVALVAAFTRYLAPAYAPDWGDEMTVFLAVWSVFIAASLLVHEERHVRADLVLRILPLGLQRTLEIATSLAALALTAVLAWYGAEMVRQAIEFDDRTVSTLRFPLWIYYACLPAGCALMALRYVRRLWRDLFRFDPDRLAGQGRMLHD